MMSNQKESVSIGQIADQMEVTNVVQTERAARDQIQWDRMRNCFHPDATVHLSWFNGGSGYEFVEASRMMYERGSRSFHQMNPSLVTLNGDRALADTGCAITVQGQLSGKPVVVCSYSRMYNRVERRNGVWRILSLRFAYHYDTLFLPEGGTLDINQSHLSGLRPSYRYLAYLLDDKGHTTSTALPGIDKPETVVALLEAERAWLKDA